MRDSERRMKFSLNLLIISSDAERTAAGADSDARFEVDA
jgi:hypothetical protein